MEIFYKGIQVIPWLYNIRRKKFLSLRLFTRAAEIILSNWVDLYFCVNILFFSINEYPQNVILDHWEF